MPRAFNETERQHIRDRLLSAARDALAGASLRRVPVEDLCRSAGISKGAFYLFFETKEALWVAVLQQAEATLRVQVRAAIAGPSPLRDILQILFRSAREEPALRALSDPEEMAWLTRGIPPEQLAHARTEDDLFFREIHGALIQAGALAADVSAEVFAGLAPLALAITQGRAVVGEDRADAVTDLVVEGLLVRLSAGKRSVTTSSPAAG